MKLTRQEEIHFNNQIRVLSDDERIAQMKSFISHGTKSTYDHCMDVTKMSYFLSRRVPFSVDEATLLRGAMLHDYYLYDWHKPHGYLHGFFHPGKALKNANRDFRLNVKEQNIIKSHMWPLTLTCLPLSKEAWIVCIADKICATRETFMERRKLSA